MLKKRIITAVALIPIVVISILCLSSRIFSLVIGGLFLWAAWEWVSLPPGQSIKGRVFGLLMACFSFTLGLWLSAIFIKHDTMKYVIPLFLISIWGVNIRSIFRYPAGNACLDHPVAHAIWGGYLIFPAWFCIVTVHLFDPHWILYLALLIWGADIGAYFAGRLFGHHKLAPQVSPGKTWEGVWGALCAAVLIGVYGYHVLGIAQLFHMPLMLWLLFSVIVVIASIFGDLTESLFKRRYGVKDSGHVLPGHGGILDRIDSLLSAAPVFLLMILWLR
jgi:phosphatidate cytidylyltransferase